MRGKVLLLRRGTLLLILTALVAAGIFMAVGGPSFVSASAAKRQLPIYSVEREEKVCAMGQRGHSGPHRHSGQIQRQGHLLRGGRLGG